MTTIDSKYQETLDYLYKFVDFSLTRNLEYSPDKFNLENMRTLAEALGNPQAEYPVIHVAGTKGKGSTAAMIASILMAADYRTGLYLSPHLEDFAERIQVNAQPIPHGALIQLVDQIKPLVEKTGKMTTFEITTALAFEAFRRQHVDAAVIEVGLGRPIGFNQHCRSGFVRHHIAFHGPYEGTGRHSGTDRGREKGGIIKPAKPVVTSPAGAQCSGGT